MICREYSGRLTARRRALIAGSGVIWLAMGAWWLPGGVFAQAAAKVDFAKEIQPLLEANCFECHGPSKQKADLRLDRRSSVLKPFSRRVVPGSSANSMLFHRVSGNDFGPQMPPKGALRPEQIASIRTWIEQGAEWPVALANEEELPPLNPKAVAMVEALRQGALASFLKSAQAEPALLNARGPEGSTPFMYAVLYADSATVAKLLKLGADPNRHNDVNATALMWAARDLDKTRLLVRYGADVNARSDDHHTPLMVAARHPGSARIVKFLLDKGANPNPTSKPVGESSPLLEALTAGDDTAATLLLRRGADGAATADQGLTMAVTTGCEQALGHPAGQERLAPGGRSGSGIRGILRPMRPFGPIGRACS